ncbi:MAG: hypothetical protein ACRDHZ_17505 [Ktedonobacteraceae bacterium]
MEHEMIVRLTDDEYAALKIEAKQVGTSLELLFHEVLARHIHASKNPQHLWTTQEFQEHLYEEGLIEHIPTGEPDSEVIKIERKRLGEIFGHGKPMSEMIIEDRGPY